MQESPTSPSTTLVAVALSAVAFYMGIVLVKRHRRRSKNRFLQPPATSEPALHSVPASRAMSEAEVMRMIKRLPGGKGELEDEFEDDGMDDEVGNELDGEFDDDFDEGDLEEDDDGDDEPQRLPGRASRTSYRSKAKEYAGKGYEKVKAVPWKKYGKQAAGAAKRGYQHVRDLPWEDYAQTTSDFAERAGSRAYDIGAAAYKRVDDYGWEQERRRAADRAKAYASYHRTPSAPMQHLPRHTQVMPAVSSPTVYGEPYAGALQGDVIRPSPIVQVGEAQANRRGKGIRGKRGGATCWKKPRKKYMRLGATKRSDYAYPECWAYPVNSRSGKWASILPWRAAKWFKVHKHRYSRAVQEKIGSRIDDALDRVQSRGTSRPRKARRSRR